VYEGCVAPHTSEPTRSAAQMPREARSASARPVTNAGGVPRREDAERKLPDDERNVISIAQRDFAKRFERGKLSFTGDVLQVISVFGRQQRFAKLLKRLTVGA
jgi:hypothetical protein